MRLAATFLLLTATLTAARGGGDKEEGFVPLFDGKSFAGWKTDANTPKSWKIENGMMVLLGGKGTLWGPVIGATLFHVIKELTWTYLLGWQWVVLGALIIVNVIFFQQGIMGWAREKWPERFGLVVDPGTTAVPSREKAA